MNKYQDIQELVNNGKYKQAYEEYSKIIDEKPQEYDAYFERALVDCYFLREYYEVSKDDLILVFNKNKKLASKVPMFLAIICDTLRDYENAIYYGELALQEHYYTPKENLLEVHFALSRSYYLRGSSIEDYTNALREVDACMKLSDELNDELLLCKCDILLVLERYDEVLEIVNRLFFVSQIVPVLYYFKARALYGKAQKKEDFEEALENFEYYLREQPNDFYTLIYKAACLKGMDLTDEAIQVYESIKTSDNIEDVTSEIIKTYEQSGKIEEAIQYASDYLKDHDSWIVKYSLGMVLAKRGKTKEELEEAKSLFEDAYLATKNEMIAESIVQIYRRLGLDEENYRFLETLVNSSLDGRFAYYLAIESFRHLGNYEVTCEYLKLAYELKYFTEPEFIDMVMSFTKKPRKYYSKIKKYSEVLNNNYPKRPNLTIGSTHKLACRYLYGMYGIQPNLDKAIKAAKSCYNILGNDCCMAILYGRTLEFARRYEEAFDVYNKANMQAQKAFLPFCTCSYGYLAHAYIQGIGTNINLDKAKELVLEGISVYKEKSDCSLLALYAYFALLNDEMFSKDEAIKYLNMNSSFALYDSSRYKLLMELDKSNSKKWNKLLKKSLKFDAILAVKYYHQHKNDKVYYPFLNNY